MLNENSEMLRVARKPVLSLRDARDDGCILRQIDALRVNSQFVFACRLFYFLIGLKRRCSEMPTFVIFNFKVGNPITNPS
jgi:hypothetical protein